MPEMFSPPNHTVSKPSTMRSSTSIPSLIKWTGSKRSQANDIARLAPAFSRYIEPFIGGGALLYLAGHKGAIVNDIYTPLVDLWRLVRDGPSHVVSSYTYEWQRLSDELDSLDPRQIGRSAGIPCVFYEIRERFNNNPNALDLNFLMRTCVNGIARFNGRGDFNNSFHLTRRGMNPDRFKAIVNAWHPILQGVEIQNCDYKVVLDLAQQGDFVYLDPPYAHSKHRYMDSLSPTELFTQLEILNSRGVRWAMSFDGRRGEKDLTYEVPVGLFNRHFYLYGGNSPVKKVLEGPIENVEESLYLNY